MPCPRHQRRVDLLQRVSCRVRAGDYKSSLRLIALTAALCVFRLTEGQRSSPRGLVVPVHERLHRLAVRKHNEEKRREEVVRQPFSSFGPAAPPLPLTPANRDNYRIGTNKMAAIS